MPAVSAARDIAAGPTASLTPGFSRSGILLENPWRYSSSGMEGPFVSLRGGRGVHSAPSRPARALETTIADGDWCEPTDAIRLPGCCARPLPRRVAIFDRRRP